jgi:hypothetical protein
MTIALLTRGICAKNATKFIAENLNSLPEVRGHQRVIVNNNFFLGADSVWSDVLGGGPQIMKLIRDMHGVIDKSSVVSDDKEFVGYSYWRRGDFPLEASRTLGMSNDDVRGGIVLESSDDLNAEENVEH